MGLREFVLAALAAFTVISHSPAAFVVNSTADTPDASPGDTICDAGGGVCTLRAALEEANANAGADTIHFAIGSGPQTIALQSVTPVISEAVTIDGTTQPGYSGTPLIEIDGLNAGMSDGLNIPAGGAGSVVRGLLLERFAACGIALGGDGNTVEFSAINTSGQDGVRVFAGDGNLIRRNTIANNVMHGVMVLDAANDSFPLFTALTPDHTAIFPSIDFNDGCSNFQHAGTGLITDSLGRGFNENFGMRLTATMSIPTAGGYDFLFPQVDDRVRLMIDGVESLNVNGPGPHSANVSLSAGDHAFEVDFWEGGGAASLTMTASGPATPAFTSGVNPGFQGELFQGTNPSTGNTISQNSIFNNGQQGIALSCCCRDVNDSGDIDYGANTFLNYPLLTNHFSNMNGSITVQGTAPIGSLVEVFASTNDMSQPGSGFGEGKLYLTTSAIVDGSGTFIATFFLPPAFDSVTTTATDAAGNTSEFSANRFVTLHGISVANTNDSGPGSLRDAIFQANGDGVDTLITFDPLLSGQSIALNTSLPPLTENGTTINGDVDADCKPDIELRANPGASNGITIQGANSRIRGLALNRFGNDAILIEGAPANNTQVLCTFLGTNLAGTAAVGGGNYGVEIRNGASGNRIAENNVIGAFGIAAVRFDGGASNVVGGTKIGLDVTGTVTMPSPIGVQLDNTNGTYVGEPGNGNRIVAIGGAVDVNGGNTSRFYGNTIDASGGYGIRFRNGANGATVGGTAPGEPNTITNNAGSGIRLDGAASDGINIRANAISGNGGLGIDLDGNGVTPNDAGDTDNGANEGQNFPVLTRATTNGSNTTVDGFLDSPVIGGNYILDFYVSSTRDPSGYGEGAAHLFAMNTPPGSFSATLPAVPVGSFVTATATALAAGNTSELSLALAAAGPPLGATELVAYPALPNAVELRWHDPNAGETGFRIERHSDAGPFGPLTNVGPNVTSFTDTTASNGTQLWYRVIATSPAGDAPPSNTASARAFHIPAMQVCRTTQSAAHQRAGAASAAWNGTNWAVAWADTRNGRASDIYVQLLNAGDGSPVGAPMPITNDDVPSLEPTLVWNGTNFGLLWYDHIRLPGGDVRSRFSFALLNANGTKVRGDVKVVSNVTSGGLNPDGTSALVWDGSGWGIFIAEAVSSPADVVFYRLDPDGDVLVNGVGLTAGPAVESSISAAWDGSNYGVSWIEQNGPSFFNVRFQRVQPNGTVIPPQRNLWTNPAPANGTSTIWDGSGFAVAFADHALSGDRIVYLNRLAADGAPLGAPVRISDNGAVLDDHPKLFVKPGGGYVVFTESELPSGIAEVGRLEADAGGNRVGARGIVSADDDFASHLPRAAANGTSFLVAFDEARVNPAEVGAVVVSAGGVAGTQQDLTTSHPPPNGSGTPVTLAMLNQFVTLWAEPLSASAPIHARITRSNGSFTDLRPLNGASLGRKPAAVDYGSRFAVAWTDAVTSGVHLERFDNNGASLGSAQIVSPVDVARGVALAYSGEVFGLVWSQSNQLTFQRVSDASIPIGSPTTIAFGPQADPQIQWLGSGWAVVWRSNQNLYFARLDPAGALLVPPTQVTDTFSNPPELRLLFSGQHLGLVWPERSDLAFTVLDANGFKQFAPVAVAATQFIDHFPAMYFDGTNFRVVYPDATSGIRDVGVTPAGALVPSPKFYGNHGEGRIAVAYNGATLGMAWQHLDDILFQTTQCLTDITPPGCPTLNGSFASGAVQLNWAPANDPQSGILAYHLYRDGKLLAELLPSTTSYTDGGFTPAAAHSYELRPFNGAYLEAGGCTPRVVTAGILLLPSTLPNGKQGNNYVQTITASQGASPYSFAVTSGALPAGISLNAGNGTISGNPTTVGLSNFTIAATDNVGATGSRAYALRVCPNTTLTPTVLPDPVLNTAYSRSISVINASGPFTAAITGGALPAGLTLAANGTLSGTPAATGACSFTITTTEPFGCTTSLAYSFTVVSGQAPRNPFAIAQSSSSILVRWDRPLRGETGFRIERSTDGTSWGSINNVGSDVTSHLDSGLGSATLYHYRVVAFSDATDSATSNVTTAMTFPLGPTKICQQVIGPYHARAQAMSVAHNGTRWAAAWNDRRDGLLEELYFQFLDNTTGAPVGSPVRVTTTDMLTRWPSLRWNGTHFGILYAENLRGPAGELTSTTNFALLDSAGNVLRSGVQVTSTTGGALNGGLDLPLVWDGGGWGVFLAEARGNPPADVYYWRLSPTGDVVTGPVRLTTAAGWEMDVAPYWNGSEYGLAWIELASGGYALKFRRMQADGTPIGSPVTLDTTAAGEELHVPNVTWNGSEWAVAWNVQTGSEVIVRLRRLNPDGSPKNAAVRVSDDPNPNQPVDDEVPLIYPKSGGGYLVFPLSFIYTTNQYDVARLEADAAGNRVGSRVYLTPDDGLGSFVLRAATDGTRFLLAHDAIGAAQLEAANIIVNASGALMSGPTAVTTGHGGGNSAGASLVPLGAGFAAIWYETGPTAQLQAKIYDGGGNPTSTKTPLSPSSGVRGRVGAVGVGSTFAVVWRDAASLRFGRFNGAGDPSIADVALPSGGNGATVAWSGEQYGVAFFEGASLRFLRVNPDGTVSGVKVIVGDANTAAAPQLLWTGSGWAIVWKQVDDFWYVLLDRNGAYAVPPIRFTFAPSPKNLPLLAFSGDRIGVVWPEARGFDPPGFDVWFTALRLDGTKAFAEKVLASSPFGDGGASIYWDADRFRILYSSGNGGTRELGVQADGTPIGTERVFHNRQLAMSIAFNGVTLGMLFNGLADLTLQTGACFDDATAPPCPNVTTSFNTQRVRLTWPFVTDAESGILAYNLYRDGVHIAELASTTGLYDDRGFVSGATHVYEVRALNRAYRESTGCTTRSVVAGIAVLPVTALGNGNVGASYNATFSGSQGTAPYTFAVTSGSLPPGLTLNSTTGQLTGAPTASGLFSFTITATDATTATGSRAYTIRVCSGITVFPTILTDGSLNSAYSQTIIASGAVGAVTLAITAGSLPAGLTLDPTGWIHGTPTALGTSNVTIAATDSLGCSASRAYSIVIGSGAAVRGLSAFALGTTSIRLRWTDPQRNENGFRIERSTNFGATWTPFTIVGANVTTFDDAALAAGTTYSYRVVATSPGGDAPASNLATAATFPSSAAKVCIQQVGPYHSAARSPSVAWNGTQWAMAYQDRKDGEDEEIYFTFLSASGAPTGTPLRITSNDMNSLRPTLRWNGSKFAIVWIEQFKGANGEAVNPYRFALLDAGGNVLRTDVRVTLAEELSQSAGDAQFFWDGSAWGFFDSRFTNDGGLDLFFHRFDEDGDPLAGPIRLTTDPAGDTGLTVAWNGTEYGLAWTRFHDTEVSNFFQRVSAGGVPIGSPTAISGPSPAVSLIGIDVAPTASGWAVSWAESADDDVVYLRRLDASGAPIGGATRLSDDAAGNSDIFPDLFTLPGGGFGVFTRAFLQATGRTEVGFLRADANGNRVGSRVIVSPQDLFNSGNAKAAFNGTNFLAAFNESRLGTQEIASVVVNQSGGIVAGPTDLTTGHSPGNSIGFISSGQPSIAILGGGFATLWSDPVSATENRVFAKIFDGAGALAATRFPLSTRNTRGRPGAVGVGSTFATAGKDSTNNIVFGRWDATGNALIAEVNIATGQGGPPNVSIGFDGEHYGVIWNGGNRLNFQRVSAAGALVGTRTTLAPLVATNVPHQIAWTGGGWAIAFVSDAGDVWYALLDINGAVLVAPIRVTFTPDDGKEGLALAWNGTNLGIAFATRPPADPPGLVIGFTVVNPDGIKQFSDLAISEGRFDNTLQGLNWDVDRFRLAFAPGESGTLRELDISAAGAILGASRMLANRGGPASIVWNGVTAGVLWSQLGEMFFETTACLADVTVPPCPSVTAARSSGPVTVSWTPVSNVHRYHIVRDGVLIADANASSTSYLDAGARGTDNHTYRVDAVTGAFRTSIGCASVVPVTVPGTLTATATSPTSVLVTWGAAAGASSYSVERSANGTTWSPLGTTSATTFSDTTALAARSYLYRVTVSAVSSNVDLATTVLFTDDPLIPGVTRIKAVHLTELRTAVNAVRTLAALPPATWTDSPTVRAIQLTELRAALTQARTTLGLSALTFTDTLTAGTPIRAVHSQEVRNGVK